MIVDIGVGENPRGDVNIDMVRTKHCNLIASVEYLPIKDESVETLLCSQVLEHLDNPVKALREINRVLKKKSGEAYIDFPKPFFTNNSMYFLLELMLNYPLIILANFRYPIFLFRILKKIKNKDPRFYHKHVITLSLFKKHLDVQSVEECGDIFLPFLSLSRKTKYLALYKPQIHTSYKVKALKSCSSPET